MFLDHCLVQPPPEKLPPAAEENKYRDPQLDKTKKARDLEHSVLNGVLPSNPSPQGSGKPAEEKTERV